jgi:Beta-lactamase superfamily domain
MHGIKITWYGRCCFLLELGITRVLIDPHDTFDGVDMGQVDADYCLISSVAHDHGHVGASPFAFAVGTPGMLVYEDVTITGIESRESRGTPNIIFNIRYKDYSITNFADFGDVDSLNDMTTEESAILRSTNIALVRPNYIDVEETVHCGELALKFCDPKMLIVHHYYPESVVQRSPNLASARSYFDKIQHMLNKLSYTRSIVSSYELEVNTSLIAGKRVFLFEQVHPQVHVIVP